jgi:MYXO-CTERM domain-containing protein
MFFIFNMSNCNLKSTPAVAGATSVAALFAVSSLDAGIVTNTALELQGFTIDTTNDSHSWNIDGTGDAELELRGIFSTVGMKDFAAGFGVATEMTSLRNFGQSQYVLSDNLNAATNAIYSVLYSGLIGYANGFTSGASGYIGFQFKPEDTTLYGWAEVILTDSPSLSFRVVQWAYEDLGANIKTGDTGAAIPEPAGAATGLGLLALGAAGVRRMRRPQAA